MPTIIVEISDLTRLVGHPISKETLLEALSNLKCEPELVSEKDITMDVTSDRPDLFSSEGLARAVKYYIKGSHGYSLKYSSHSPIQLHVQTSVSKIRPYIVAAAITGIQLSNEALLQIMQLQEKLHNTYGLKRHKASIGVYNLDQVKPDIFYEALPPKQISFMPLDESVRMDGYEILQNTPKGQEYSEIIKSFDRYPLLRDCKGTVLSMPPIINSEDTRVDEHSRNLFIDVTGTDQKAINLCLNIMVTSILERGGRIQRVAINYDDETSITPCLERVEKRLEMSTMTAMSGLLLTMKDTINLLGRMGFESKSIGNKSLKVSIPPYRMDILHEADLVEDIIMAYGLNNMPVEFPKVATIGKPLHGSRFRARVRDLMVATGFQEISTYLLTNKSLEEKASIVGINRVEIENPVSSEYSSLRTSLLPKMLLFLGNNTHNTYPQRIFEYGDVTQVIDGMAKTTPKLAAAISDNKASFEDIQAVAVSLLQNLSTKANFQPVIREPFIEGRVAAIFAGGEEIGTLGEVSPKKLADFGLVCPVGMMELNLSNLLHLESLFRG